MPDTHFPIRSKIRGVTHDGRQKVVATLEKDDMLRLLHETDNAYDPNAVLIETLSCAQVGYVSRELAVRLAPLLDDGWVLLARVLEVTGAGKETLGVNIEITGQPHGGASR